LLTKFSILLAWNEKCKIYLAMNKIPPFLLFLILLLSTSSSTPEMERGTARFYYGQGLLFFNNGDYDGAVSAFIVADEFQKTDSTANADSIRYMYRISTRCKNHKDAGDNYYNEARYMDALPHYNIVLQNNNKDEHCRKRAALCWEKGNNVMSGMVKIKGGYFTMGRNDGPSNEQPAHVVHIDDFYMSAREVSNREFVAFLNICGIYSVENVKRMDVGNANCDIVESGGWYSVKEGRENYPALCVSWYGARDYAGWLGMSLPTEAQWEYAFGDAVAKNRNSIVPIGTGVANNFGLYNMADNCREWIEDWYHDNIYRSSSNTSNPMAHAIAENKVVRGGIPSDTLCNVKTFRNFEDPSDSKLTIGFRCVKNN